MNINPTTLFLRLVTIVERNPQQEIVDFFFYGLPPYSMSLFKDGFMRAPSKKSILKDILMKNASHVDPIDLASYRKVLDGGALL